MQRDDTQTHVDINTDTLTHINESEAIAWPYSLFVHTWYIIAHLPNGVESTPVM